MGIFCKFGRFWSILCPVALLVVTFKYAHQINSILNAIEGVSFKIKLVIIFIAFFALWSLLHLSSVLFVRVMSWIWKGKKATSTEKRSANTEQEFEEPFRDKIEHHNVQEQEKLFKLDLHNESKDSFAERK